MSLKTISGILVALSTTLYSGIYGQMVNTGEMIITEGTLFAIQSDFDNQQNATFFNDGEVYAYSHWNNDGIVDTVSNTSTTYFIGNTAQHISGSAINSFYNVVFSSEHEENTASFELSGDIRIFNQVNFEFGIVATDEFGGSITFENDATHINTSNASYVDGIATKIGNTAFDFPIGDGGFYRPLSISAPATTSDSFDAKYVLENSNTQFPHYNKQGHLQQVNDAEYWSLNTTNTSPSNVFVSLSWNENTTPSTLLTTLENIRMVRWDAEPENAPELIQSLWVMEPSTTDTTNEVVESDYELSEYGIFSFANSNTNEELPGGVVLFNFISPSDTSNNHNDFFLVDGIENFPDNTVRIFNRWGVEVYSTRNYNQKDNVFRGFSNGRGTPNSGEPLPTGTYYYILEYLYQEPDGSGQRVIKKADYLYIN